MATPDVTAAELAVLRRLWEMPGATIRQLTDHLYPRGGTAHYSTVQKLLERLESKECVTRDAETAPHHFAAAIGREELMGGRLRELADRFCEGSLTPLITHLIDSRQLSAGDIDALRALIEKAGKGRKR